MKNTRSRILIFTLMALLSAAFLVPQGVLATEKRQVVITPIGNNLDNWKIKGNVYKSYWTIGAARLDPKNSKKLVVSDSDQDPSHLVNSKKGQSDIYTKETFGDCTIELEVMVPKKSNSGIYVMGQYEVQIKDSYGKKRFFGDEDMGAITDLAKPQVNASKKPGQWQKIFIEFKAPRFANGKRVAPAEFVKVVLNNQVIHRNVKMEKGASSGSLRKGEFPKGPLMFQGGLGAVAYRNIKITTSVK